MSKLSNYLKNNKNLLLIGAGIGMQLSATISAIDASKQYYNDNNVKTKKDKVKLFAKCYLPVFVLHAAGTTSIILAAKNMQNIANSALLLASNAYGTLNTYKQKTGELLGQKAKQKVDTQVAQKQVNDSNDNNLIPDDKKQLFREPITGQEFLSTWSDIEKAAVYANKVAQSGSGIITVNDWLRALNINCGNDTLDCLGWKVYSGTIIEPISSMVMKGNYPIGQIEYSSEPTLLSNF